MTNPISARRPKSSLHTSNADSHFPGHRRGIIHGGHPRGRRADHRARQAGSDLPVSAHHNSGALPVTRKVASTVSSRSPRLSREVDLAAGQLPMHKQNSRVAFRPGVVKVRRHVQSLQHRLGILSCLHLAFAHRVQACSIAKQLIVQSLKLGLIVREARCVRRSGPYTLRRTDSGE